MRKNLKLILSILICEFAGIIGSIFTINSIPGWYAGLVKPSFNPPNWLFGPVWTILYLLMGISLYLIWTSKSRQKKNAIIVFAVQLFLNSIWTIIFFGMKMPLAGFIEIVLLWISIIVTMIFFYRISKPAFYLLIPYILWVSFAAVLNLSLFILN